MAKQLNVNLAFTANTSQAKAQIQSLQQTLQSLSTGTNIKGATQLSNDLIQAKNAAGQLKVVLEQATNVNTGNLDLSKLNKSLSSGSRNLTYYRQQLEKLGPSGIQAFGQLAQSIMQAEIPIKRTQGLLDEFATTLKNTARWQIASSAIHGVQSAIQSAYSYAQGLNKSLNDIRIVSGLSAEEMDKFADRANQAAQALSTTTKKYTDAALIFYQQGLSDSEVEKRTNATIKMANVTGEAVDDVSSYMTAVWNNFNKDGTQSAEHFGDVMTKLGADTAASTEEIAGGLEKFAAVADTIGLSFEYATSAITTIVDRTRQSEDVVGTALKTIFSRIQGLQQGETLDDGTDLNKYSQGLAKVGVQIKDATGNLKNMDDILDDIGSTWSTLSREQKVALAQTVAGVRQYSQFMALFDNWDFMKENLDTAYSADGTLEKQAEIYAESWEAAQKRVRATAEDIYNDLLDDDFFIQLNNSLADLLSYLDSFIERIGGLKSVLPLVATLMFKVFGNQMGKSIDELVYRIQLADGTLKKQALELQKKVVEEANVVANNPQADLADQQMAKDMATRVQLQQKIAEISDIIGASKSKELAGEVEVLKVLQDQTIELQKQVDLSKMNAEDASLNLMGRAYDSHSFNTTTEEDKMVRMASTNIESNIKRSQKAKEEIMTAVKAYRDSGNKNNRELNQALIDISNRYGSNVLGDSVYNRLKASGKKNRSAASQADFFEAQSGLIDRSARQSVINETMQYANSEGIDWNARQVGQVYDAIIAKLQQEKNLQENVNQAADRQKKIEEEILQALEQANNKLGTTGQTIIQLSTGLSSLSFGISSLISMFQTLSNEDATFGEKFMTVLTVAPIALPQIITGISTLASTLKIAATGALAYNAAISAGQTVEESNLVIRGLSKVALLGENAAKIVGINLTGAQTAANVGLLASMAPLLIGLGLVVAAIGALVGVVVLAKKAFDVWEASTPEGKLKAAQEASESFTSSLEELKNQANSIFQAFEEYDSIVDKLDSCTKGTKEWYEALAEAREQTAEFVKEFPELINYIENGLLTSEGIDKYSKYLENKINTGNATQYALNNQVLTAKENVENNDDSYLRQLYNQTSLEYRHGGKDIDPASFTTFKRSFESIINTTENTEEALKSFSQSIGLSDDALIDYAEKLKTFSNQDQKNLYNQNIGASLLGSEVENNPIAQGLQRMAGAVYSKEFDSLYNKYSQYSGKNLAKLYQEKANLKNTTYEENDGTYTFKNSSGEIVSTIDESAMASTIAGLEAAASDAVWNTFEENAEKINSALKKVGQEEEKQAFLDIIRDGGLTGNITELTKNYYEVAINAIGSLDKELREQLGLDSNALQEQLNNLPFNDYTGLKNYGNLTADELSGITKAVYEGSVSNKEEVSFSEWQDSSNYKDNLKSNAQQYIDLYQQLGESEREVWDQVVNEGFNNLEDLHQKILDTIGDADLSAEADQYDLDVDSLNDYAEHLQDIAESSELVDDRLKDQQEVANQVAVAIARLNKGVKSLSENYEDWADVIKKSDKSSQEYSDAISGMRDALGDIFNAESDYVSNDFIVNHLKEIEAASKGSESAIDSLGKAFARDVAQQSISTLIGEDLDKANEAIEKFFNAYDGLSNLDSIEIGALIDNEGFAEALNQMIQDTGMTTKQIQSLLGGLNLEAEITEVDVNQMTEIPITRTETTLDDTFSAKATGASGRGYTVSIPNYTTRTVSDIEHVPTKTTVPQIAYGKDAKGKNVPKIFKAKSGKVNNFSSINKGGGSGKKSSGGGSKSKTDKVQNKTKRYHRIDDELDDTAKKLDKISTLEDRLYGSKRIAQINNRIKQYEKENKQLEKRKKLAEQYFKTDVKSGNKKIKRFNSLTGAKISSIKLDKDGDIINYNQILSAAKKRADNWVNKLNKDPDNEKLQKKVENIKEAYEKLAEGLTKIEDTRDELLDTNEQIAENLRNQQDAYFEKLSYKIEIKLEINEQDLTLLEHYYDKISDQTYKRAEAIQYLWQSAGNNNEIAKTTEKLSIYNNEYKELQTAYKKGKISQADFVEGMKEVRDGALDIAEALQDLDKQMLEYYSDTLDMVSEEIEKFTNRIDNLSSALEHYLKVMDLLGKNKNYDQINAINTALKQTIKNNYDIATSSVKMYKTQQTAAKTSLDTFINNWSGTYEEMVKDPQYEALLKNYDAITEKFQEACDQQLNYAETYLETLNTLYENAIDQIADKIEDSFTNGKGFDALNDSLSNIQTNWDEYLTPVNKVYELTKLVRKASQDLEKTDNAAAKQRYKAYITETEQLKDKTEFSQLELEIQQAKYKQLQAQIALEEAQNAKSVVRLSRDNEGNYGYIYTANKDNISDAQQALDDANNDLYNIALKGQNNYGQKIIQLNQQLNEKLAEIDKKYKDDEKKRLEEKKRVTEEYTKLMTTYSNLYAIAGAADSRAIDDAWVNAYKDIITNGDLWKDAIKKQTEESNTAFKNYHDEADVMFKDLGLNADNYKETISKVTSESQKLHDEAVNKTIPALNKMSTAVLETATAYAQARQSVLNYIASLEQLAKKAGSNVEKESGSTYNAWVRQLAAKKGLYLSKEDSQNILHFSSDKSTAQQYAENANKNLKSQEVLTWNNNVAAEMMNKTGYFTFDEKGKIHYTTASTIKAAREFFDKQGYKYGKIQSFDAGGYTGEWGNSGKLAMLHQKELVLNAEDTKNFLAGIEVLRDVVQRIDLQAMYAGSTNIAAASVESSKSALAQEVKIHAEFPNAVNHNEIEQAFDTLINRAAQYANRK